MRYRNSSKRSECAPNVISTYFRCFSSATPLEFGTTCSRHVLRKGSKHNCCEAIVDFCHWAIVLSHWSAKKIGNKELPVNSPRTARPGTGTGSVAAALGTQRYSRLRLEDGFFASDSQLQCWPRHILHTRSTLSSGRRTSTSSTHCNNKKTARSK